MTSDKLDPDILKLLSEQVDAGITKMLSDKFAKEAADSLKQLGSTTAQVNLSDMSEKLRSLTEMMETAEMATGHRHRGKALIASTPHHSGVRDKGFASWSEPFDGYKTTLSKPTSEYGVWIDEADYLPSPVRESEPGPKQKVDQDKPQTEFDVVW